jgi:hypothetical protein
MIEYSLDKQSSSTEMQHQSPVLIVLQQSIPLFELLISASNRNADVIDGVCDSLKNGLGSLLELASILVPSYCNLLSSIIVDRPTAAFAVVKALFLVRLSFDLFIKNLFAN